MLAGLDAFAEQRSRKNTSVKALLTPQTSEAADVRKREREAEEILVTHIGDRVTAVFQRHATAVPVVGGLRANELELANLSIKADATRTAKSPLVLASIAQGGPELIENSRLGSG